MRIEVTCGNKPITIRVSSEAAFAYESAPAEQRRKLDALLSLRLTEVVAAKRPLEEIMSEISLTARERGLTPEILESRNRKDDLEQSRQVKSWTDSAPEAGGSK